MRKYQAPIKEFFRLPNSIFTIPMTPIEFRLYAYLVCCAGSKGYCWPTFDRIIRDTGIKKTSLQNAIKDANIRENWSALVLGLERGAYTITNPNISLTFEKGDLLWVLGKQKMLNALIREEVL